MTPQFIVIRTRLSLALAKVTAMAMEIVFLKHSLIMKHGISGVHSFLRTCWFSLSGLHFYSNSALFVGFDFGFGISGNFKARSGITVFFENTDVAGVLSFSFDELVWFGPYDRVLCNRYEWECETCEWIIGILG
ncbi:Transcription factor IWS1 [Fusarium oxysporum f. sp. albedinis]|nr:Transcription factor IWS1 [Fusarium oxysporum f. sp. albedinis]